MSYYVFKIYSDNCDEVYIGTSNRPIYDLWNQYIYYHNMYKNDHKGRFRNYYNVIECCDSHISVLFDNLTKQEAQIKKIQIKREYLNLCVNNKLINGKYKQKYRYQRKLQRRNTA